MTDREDVQCVVLAPSVGQFRPVVEKIVSALRDSGVDAIAIPGGATDPSRVQFEWRLVEGADFIIADVTGKHPDVIYNLGFAHAMRIPVTIITSDEDLKSLPASLKGELIYIYDINHLDPMLGYLASVAERVVELRAPDAVAGDRGTVM